MVTSNRTWRGPERPVEMIDIDHHRAGGQFFLGRGFPECLFGVRAGATCHQWVLMIADDHVCEIDDGGDRLHHGARGDAARRPRRRRRRLAPFITPMSPISRPKNDALMTPCQHVVGYSAPAACLVHVRAQRLVEARRRHRPPRPNRSTPGWPIMAMQGSMMTSAISIGATRKRFGLMPMTWSASTLLVDGHGGKPCGDGGAGAAGDQDAHDERREFARDRERNAEIGEALGARTGQASRGSGSPASGRWWRPAGSQIGSAVMPKRIISMEDVAGCGPAGGRSPPGEDPQTTDSASSAGAEAPILEAACAVRRPIASKNFSTCGHDRSSSSPPPAPWR